MSAEPHVIEAGAGRPVVLLHAFPLDASMWAAQCEHLASRWRVLCPDQRGFGGSPLPGGAPPDVNALADDVAALLDSKRIREPVVLGGLSMGGYVAMAFARRHPNRLAALVLADTKATADSAAAAGDRDRIAAEVLAAGTSAHLADQMLPKLLGVTTLQQRPQVVARVRALVQTAPPSAVAWAQRAMAGRQDSFDVLQAVGVPTLVLVGAEDTLSPPSDASAIAAAVPGARLAQIPAAGHLSAMETPAEFNAALDKFLAGVPS